MERNKGMAILIAIATAMLVIVAGKSCANDIQKRITPAAHSSLQVLSKAPHTDLMRILFP